MMMMMMMMKLTTVQTTVIPTPVTRLKSRNFFLLRYVKKTEVQKSGTPGCRATTFCTVAPHICESSVWNLLHVTILTPRNLRYFLGI